MSKTQNTNPPDPMAGKLFGLITSQLETALQISLEGHQSSMDNLRSTANSLHVQLADIGILLEAIEAILKDRNE